MKRSEINIALRQMEALVERYKFVLPPFCYFTPEEWKEKGHELLKKLADGYPEFFQI